MKQYKIVYLFIDQSTNYIVIVNEFGFSKYIKKRIQNLKKQENIIDYHIRPIKHSFFYCLFRYTEYIY